MSDQHLVLFDIDGTLLHSGGCGRAATDLALMDVFGTTGTLATVNFAGKTDWQILYEILQPEGFSREQIDERLMQHNFAVSERLTHIIREFPVVPCIGAPEVVAALRTDSRAVMGLVTGNMQAIVPIKLRTAGYEPDDFLVGAYGSEGWERAMLPPIALKRAQAHTGRTFAPENIVIIGDTPNDIACATSIGARTIAVATGPFTAEQLRQHHPDHVFEDMHDVERVIAAILNTDVPN